MSRPQVLRRFRHARCWIPDDLASITDIGHEDPAAAGGMQPADVEAIWDAAVALFRKRLHPVLSLCLRRRGKVMLHRTIGFSHGGGPDAPDGWQGRTVATNDTPLCIFSASKAITAMVIHLLDERGLLHIDDRVIEYWPEFAGTDSRKQWVTLRHVLTHRAGFPTTGESQDVEMLTRWDDIVAALAAGPLRSAPGHTLAYHALTGGFVLGEVVRRVTGKTIREVLRDEILSPSGITGLNYGVAPEDLPLVAQNHFTGIPVFPPMTGIARFVLGMSFERAAELSNTDAFLTSIVPSGNIVGTADELSRFFQLLLNGGELDGVRVFEPRTINRSVQRTTFRGELDLSLLLPLRYGLGFMLGGALVSPFGPDTPAAFGHLGLMNIHCWADRWRDSAVALITTGKPLVSDHGLPLWQLLSTISARTPRIARS